MKVLQTIADLKTELEKVRKKKQKVGLVPTMGALHEGHISLILTAKQYADVVIASVFVNPTQFDKKEDLIKYPRTLEKDRELLEQNGCDFLFAPSVEEMYPGPSFLNLNFGILEKVMEGKYRDGHFNGVGIIVSKLFHLVAPDYAFFGQKDLQQVAVIKALVRDLSFQLEIVVCPTVRENNGLAMSSRNERLSLEAREEARILYAFLCKAQEKVKMGVAIESVKKWVQESFIFHKTFELEYIEVVDALSLQALDNYESEKNVAICIAAYVEGVRLIDNVVF